MTKKLQYYTQTVADGHMGIVVRKPVFGVSDKARLKPVFSATETTNVSPDLDPNCLTLL